MRSYLWLHDLLRRVLPLEFPLCLQPMLKELPLACSVFKPKDNKPVSMVLLLSICRLLVDRMIYFSRDLFFIGHSR